MSREEDLIRSTTRALASAVRAVPPLHLESAADELGARAVAPRRTRGRSRGGASRPRHWWSWGAPLTAAAAVVALAISLVVVRDIPNEPVVPKNPAAAPSASPGAVPRYYVAIQPYTGDPLAGTGRSDIVVGDSLTGKTLATLTPPAETSFQSVAGAADDRTFVVEAVRSSTVEAVRSSTGKFNGPVFSAGATMTASWFVVRLAPGTAHPAQLVRLPVKPQSWVIPKPGPTSPMEVLAMALSRSGQELAIGDTPEVAGRTEAEVKVVSVATGRLLHDWTTADPSVATAAWHDAGSGLTWIDGDQALALAIVDVGHRPYWEEFLRLNVTGPASGDLVADSQVIKSWPESGSSKSCFAQDSWVPYLTADGNTAVCAYFGTGKLQWQLTFRTDTLTAGTPAVDQATTDYQYTESTKYPSFRTADFSVLWADPSGTTLIATWVFLNKVDSAANATSPYGFQIGVVSHGKFTPLHLPAALTNANPGLAFTAERGYIAF